MDTVSSQLASEEPRAEGYHNLFASRLSLFGSRFSGFGLWALAMRLSLFATRYSLFASRLLGFGVWAFGFGSALLRVESTVRCGR